MNAEKKLSKRFGKANPFTVPDYYFNDFTGKVMNSLPKREISVSAGAKAMIRRRLIVRRMRQAVCAAAVAGGIFFGVNTARHFYSGNINDMHVMTGKVNTYDEYDRYLDDVFDHADISKDEIYSYVSGQDESY